MKEIEIIELVQDCKLVKVGSECNGHDCWGNLESSSYKYVIINGEQQKCFDDWYVIHDGENVKEIVTKFLLGSRNASKAHLKKTGFETPREYAAYLKGFNLAVSIAEDYDSLSSHPNRVSDCIRAKANRLPKSKIRKNAK